MSTLWSAWNHSPIWNRIPFWEQIGPLIPQRLDAAGHQPIDDGLVLDTNEVATLATETRQTAQATTSST